MKSVIVVQHCESEHHVNALTGGWTDTPLTDFGVQQATNGGRNLSYAIKDENYLVYSSDLKRAFQTAEIITDFVRGEIFVDSRLREKNNGEAAWKTRDWERQNRKLSGRDGIDIDCQEFDGAETYRQFYRRICQCMQQLWQNNKENLLIVTHGGVLSYIMCWWLYLPEEMLSQVHFRAQPASVTILQESNYGQRVVHAFNDKSYFKEQLETKAGT